MSSKKINVAIDGYSGCGKSTTAKAVAEFLKYRYIDTGAMYRAVTLFFMENEVNLSDRNSVQAALNKINLNFEFNEADQKAHIFLNGQDVELEIRKPEVSALVSPVAAISIVRKEMVRQQQVMGKDKGVVMDGRDIGTVVFPDAECKFFMRANVDIRASRRLRELKLKGIEASFQEVKMNLLERDRIDSSRADSPLRRADDAYIIDTSNISIEEQIEEVIDIIQRKLRALN